MQEYLDSLQIQQGEIRRIHPLGVFILVVQKMDNEWQIVPFSQSAARTEEGDMLLPNATGHCVLQLQRTRTLHPIFLRRSFLVGTLTDDELETVLDPLAKVDMDLTGPSAEFSELDIANYCWGNQVMTFTGVQVDLPPAPPEEDLSPCWYFDSPSISLLSQLSFKEAPPPSKPSAYHARFCYPEFAPAPKDPDSNLLWDIDALALPHGNYDALFINSNTKLLIGSGFVRVNEFGANAALSDWVVADASGVKHPGDITILVCNAPRLS